MGIKNCPSCGYTGNWSFANICQRCGHKLRLVLTARAMAWLMLFAVCAGLGAAFYRHIRVTASQESLLTCFIGAGIKLEGWWEDISRPGSSFDTLSLAPEKTGSVDAKQLAEVPAEPAQVAAAPPSEPAPAPPVQAPKPAAKPAVKPAAKPEPAQPAVSRQKSVFKLASEFFSAAFASKPASPAAQAGAKPEAAKPAVPEKKPVIVAAAIPPPAAKPLPPAAKPVPEPSKPEPKALPGPRPAASSRVGMAFISAGSFTIGSPAAEGGEGDERPQAQVSLDAYYMDVTETTISDYAKCVAAGYCKEPRKGPGCNWGKELDNNPANCISWPQAAAFCEWKGKRLPTEAEWENAARAGSAAAYYYGEDKKQLGVYAWYDRNSDDITHPVAARKPNAYGLYDMSGNVWEWVSDWYASGYAGIAKSNPRGPASGQDKVLRGGSSVQDEMAARSANRFKAAPSGADKMFGFRCAAPAN